MKVKPQVEDNKGGKEVDVGKDEVYSKRELENLNTEMIAKKKEKRKKYHYQDDRCYKCGRKDHFA